MVSVCKLGGTINQTGVKGGKSKRSKIPPQSLSFSFSPRPRFSRFAAHHSPLVRSRDVRSIALKTLGKERNCSQSILRTKTRCRSVHARGFTAGQKTMENQNWATGPPGRRAVAGRGPVGLRAAGPLGRRGPLGKTRITIVQNSTSRTELSAIAN